MQRIDRSAGCLAWLLCWLTLSYAFMIVCAQTTAYSRADVTGNDIDCGQGSKKCRICGDINSIESSCRANPACAAFSFDNSCGYLKTSGDPRTYREGYTVFTLVGKSPTAAPTPAAATAAPGTPPNATAVGPAPVAAAAPAAAAAAAPAPAPVATATPATQPVAAPTPAAAAAPATTTAAAGGGGCALNAWDQCGGQGNGCTGPGRTCVDAPFPGCTCPANNPCQKKDSFFYQCAPPGHFGSTAAATPAAAAAATPASTETVQVSTPEPHTTQTGSGTTSTAQQQQGGPYGASTGFGGALGPGGFFFPGGRRLLESRA